MSRKETYPVIFTQLDDEKNTILVEIPDLGVRTEGYGITNAIEMARDAIGLMAITMDDLGEEIHEPTEINLSVSEYSDYGKQYISYVDIDFEEYKRRNDTKAVRRNVTLPNWLNREAEKAHLNVSRILQEALMAKLGL